MSIFERCRAAPGKPAGMNGFVHYNDLIRMGWEKPMKQTDEKIASRQSAYV